ncbi:MAG: ATP-grasp domain-containing protein [Candidatus Omnitrophica bacterium]|nr:ATP-grasp domain-containing protein [Candidatus Omnitrophota bacterium]
MGKKVGLTYDVKTDWALGSADPGDTCAEFDKPKTIDNIVRALESGGHTVDRIGNVHNLMKRLDNLDVDIVFNICEGRNGRNRESQVPVLLEMKGIPFVGADALSLGVTLDKVVAKQLFVYDGIPTPRFFVAHHTDNLEKLNTIGFPLMVKTRHEGSSKGISEKSRVEDYEGLKRQVQLVNEVYHQTALVEEFIKGKEFTVPILGNNPPEAMPIIQVSIDGNSNLGNQFYTFERIASDRLQYICPAKISPELTKKMQELAIRVYKIVGCRDFGRVDFRVDDKDNPYALEINPLPSLDEQDAFNIFPQVLGSDYAKTINRILNFALERYGLKP